MLDFGMSMMLAGGGVARPDPPYVNLLVQPLSADSSVTDKSSYSRSITNSSVTLAGISPFSGYKAAFFNGTDGTKLAAADSDGFYLQYAFALDFVVYLESVTGTHFMFEHRTDANNRMMLYWSGSTVNFDIVSGGSTVLTLTDNGWTTGSWIAGAVSMTSAGVYNLYRAGTRRATTTSAVVPANYTGDTYIGSRSDSTLALHGYVGAIRVSNGDDQGYTGASITDVVATAAPLSA